MLKSWALVAYRACMAALMALPAAHLQAQETLNTNAADIVRRSGVIDTLGPGLFGDQVNTYTGALHFVHTDVALRGNDSLPVQVGRRLQAGKRAPTPGHFADWELDIPRIYGVFSASKGWTVEASTLTLQRSRCTGFAAPPYVRGADGQSIWAPEEYWHGSFLHTPETGGQEILLRTGLAAPTDGGSYPLATSQRWVIGCLPTLANTGSSALAQGEGFLAVAPNGTRWRFDWLVSRGGGGLAKSIDAPLGRVGAKTGAPLPGSYAARYAEASARLAGESAPGQPQASNGAFLPRQEVSLLPTQATDVHGNTVTYTYSPSEPWKLLSIVASDGRFLSFTYVPGTNSIATVSDGTRTWVYEYETIGHAAVLRSVVQPDGSRWQFTLRDLNNALTMYVGNPSCDEPGMMSGQMVSGSMTHPSGATGRFTLQTTLHGRSHASRDCWATGPPGSGSEYAFHPRYFGTYSLVEKRLTGPGLDALTWWYSYGPPNASWAPCSGCAETKTVSVTDARGHVTRHTFGNRADVSEGKLLLLEEGWNAADGTSARSTSTSYLLGPEVGYSVEPRGDGRLASRYTPLQQRSIAQQTAALHWRADAFDTMYRPTAVVRWSSLGYTRSETTTYSDNLNR